MKYYFFWLNPWIKPGKARQFFHLYTSHNNKRYVIYRYIDNMRDKYFTYDEVVFHVGRYYFLRRPKMPVLYDSYETVVSILDYQTDAAREFAQFGDM